MGRSTADAHLLLRAQVGGDKRDAFSTLPRAAIPNNLSGTDLGRLRVAVSADLGCAPVDPTIATLFRDRVRQVGHVFREVQERSPDMAQIHETFETLRGVQYVAAYGELLLKRRELLGRNVIDNTERGFKLSVADISRACAN